MDTETITTIESFGEFLAKIIEAIKSIFDSLKATFEGLKK